MGMFELGGMTLKWLFHKPATKQYPQVQVPPYPGRRGHIENDIQTCILCSRCVKGCPADALEVDRKNRTWSINLYRCIQCENCVRVCPTHSLTMSEELAGPTTHISAIVHTKPEDTSKKKVSKNDSSKQS